MSKIADVLIDHEERYGKAKAEYLATVRRMLLIGWNYDDYITAVECVGRMHAVALSAVENFGDDRWMTDYNHTNVEEHLLTELGLWPRLTLYFFAPETHGLIRIMKGR